MEIDLKTESDSVVVCIIESSDSSPTYRGIPVGQSLERVKNLLGQIADEMVKSLSDVKNNTKELTIEMAFEVTSTLDLKIVDVNGSANFKIIAKI